MTETSEAQKDLSQLLTYTLQKVCQWLTNVKKKLKLYKNDR